MISVDGLAVEFGGTTLFSDISFVINEKDRIALMGKNGAGKSTLLKILAGVRQPTRGKVSAPKDCVVAYLPQHLMTEDGRTVFDETAQAFAHLHEMEAQIDRLNKELETRTDYESDSYMALIEEVSALSEKFYSIDATNYEEDVEKSLLGLGFTREDFQRQTSDFSGGWRMRIELAKLLLQKPDVLLLDEPTNHLDIESIQWLEDFLINNGKAVIVISHDRKFVDNITTRTIEVTMGRIYDYKVNYSQYLTLRKERREQQQKAYDEQQKFIAETKEFIERFKGTYSKTLQVQSRVKMLEKLELLEVDEEDTSALRLKFPPSPRSGSYPVIMEGVGKTYGNHVVFRNANLTVERGDKVAFVGKNGEGKSTLVKCIMKEIEHEGTLTLGHNVQIGYFAQNQASLMDENLTVFQTIDDVAKGEIRNKIRDLLGAFMFGGPEESMKKVKVLSGGERTRLAMIKLLLEPVNLLILDEPTNHLDIESIGWLENYLKEYNGAGVLISHDRAFLDNVTTRTIEISLGKVYDYRVPYSRYVELRRERREQQMAAYVNQQKMIEQTEDFIERFRYKPTKSNQVQSRIKQLDRLERIEVEEEDLATLNIKFPPAPRSGQIVAEIKEAGMSFGSKHVFSGANFTIERGDKIALVGRNGEGKTTLARMIVGQLTPTEGSIRVGANVNIGYYAQNQEDLMNGDFTVYDTLDRVAVGDVRTRLRDILGAFLFRGEDIDKKVKVLSGGERARLAMARLMLEPYNLLILDEPTNHMDMRSKDILKNAIMKYDGTVIVVSHDREFLDGMVSKVYEFRNGGVREYLGGIYYFLEKRKLESLQEVERKDAPAKEAAPKASSSGKLTYEQKKEQEKLLRKLRKAVETIEASLADLEKKIADYDRKFAEATQYNEADYKAYNELKAEYDHQMHEWEKASYELEITEGE